MFYFHFSCDCRPGYLFYPVDQKCYASHLRGPCQNGYFLRLMDNSKIPQCQLNQCNEGQVFFHEKCQKLGGEEDCKNYKSLLGREVVVAVDPTTLEIACRDKDEFYTCTDFCCKGSDGSLIGKCN